MGSGGGGGFFFASAAANPVAVAFAGDGAVAIVPFSLAALPPPTPPPPYRSYSPLAVLAPAATCSPCLSRKLLAVLAASFISEKETLLGSWRKATAVLRAACFCAQVVPPPAAVPVAVPAVAAVPVPFADAEDDAGVDAGDDDRVLNWEKRALSSLAVECDSVVVVVGRVEGGDGGTGDEVEEERPMPKPGTDIPAAPRRFMEFWLRRPVLLSTAAGADGRAGRDGFDGGGGGANPGEVAGEEELDRGGRRGGKEGSGPAPRDVPGGGGAARPFAPSFLPGGGGKWEVSRPVVSRLHGFGGGAGSSGSD